MTRARDLAAFVSNADGDIKFDTDTLFIDSSANRVGLGETAPERALHIKSADNIIGLIESTDADAWLAFQDDTSSTNNAVRVGATGDVLRFYAGSAERLSIDANGSIIPKTSGTDNVHLGEGAGVSIASGGNQNTLIGKGAGTALTTGDNNVAIGHEALKTEDAHGSNVAVGYGALETMNAGTNAENTAVGNLAGNSVTDGVRNVFIGGDVASQGTTLDDCVIIGWEAARNDVITGHDSVIIGQRAGYSTSSGGAHTFLGKEAGFNVSTANFNTFIGYQSGKSVTSGQKNTILGSFNGNEGGLDIRTSSANIVLSDGDGNPRGYWHGGLTSPKWVFQNPTSGQTAMQIVNSGSPSPFGVAIKFENAAPDNNTQYFLDCSDNAATRARIESDGDFQSADNSFGSLSDEKLKENIADASSQWDDIKAVRVRKFSMKSHNSDTANRIGVIAQELEASGMNGLVKECPDLIQEGDTITEADTSTKAVKYSILYMKAIKALQEAMARIETLETKVAALESE